MIGVVSVLATRVRRMILEQSMRANVGHIGSALSIVELLTALYGDVVQIASPGDAGRDRVVLSKGHAALALYAVLCATGRLSEDDLNTFCGDGSRLGGHPEHVLDYVDFATGSLGHGLSIGTGAALAARLDGSSRRTFVVMSDAECNEGSVWEAAMFAAHHQLSSLTLIIDVNGQQALNYTHEILDLAPLARRWSAFGWDVHEVAGHDEAALVSTLRDLDTASGPPHVLVADTTFGKGVSYMESRIEWHYWPMNGDQFTEAMRELEDVAT
jgi:transketolase